MDGPKAVVERENNAWVDYADWPVPGAEATTLRFSPAADANAIGQLGVAKPASSAIELIVDDSSIDANVLVAAAASPNRLVYQSAPLTRARARQRHPVSVAPAVLRQAGRHRQRDARGLQGDRRAGHRHARLGRSAEPRVDVEDDAVVPGTAYTMTFELQPHDYIFPPGSRIGLVLLSSDRLFTLRPPPGTRLSVYTAQSTLSLPVVGGEPSFVKAVR